MKKMKKMSFGALLSTALLFVVAFSMNVEKASADGADLYYNECSGDCDPVPHNCFLVIRKELQE